MLTIFLLFDLVYQVIGALYKCLDRRNSNKDSLKLWIKR
jgi:hypothetical protein